jgi:hypothetical protein
VVLAIAVAVAVVLGAGAVIAFVAYDKATKLDRSTPAVALQQFLGAVFSDEDPARVSLFICSRWNAQDAIATIRSGINPTNTVSWGGLAGEGAGGRATVTGQMEVSDDQFADVQNWEFDNVDENGWRVCGAHQTS